MTPEEFRTAGYRLIDWIADYRENVAEYPVMSRAVPGAMKAELPKSPPEDPVGFETILTDLQARLLTGLSHWQHPSFFGYFPANSLLSSVLGDYLSTGLGVLGLSWQSSPALTELEEVTTDWVRQLVALSEKWSGVIQDTASTSTLVALICARERASAYSLSRSGIQDRSSALVVYTSSQAHSSVEKAAILAGFGRENVQAIAHDEVFAMKTDALDEAIQTDIACGKTPCAVVATIGTTTSMAMDPLAAVSDVALRHGLWLHVDAAMAGSAMILPECRPLWNGIEAADSLVLNAHKWLGAAFDCSLYYVRDPEHLVRVMSTNPSYLQTDQDSRVKNFRDWGIPLGRRFRALKLWTLIRIEGAEKLRTRLRRDIENARWLANMVANTLDWKLLAPVSLQTLCMRHEPTGLADKELDAHTLSWVDRVNRSGKAYVTPAILDGRWMVRVSIGVEATERQHVEELWKLFRREAEQTVE